MNKMIWLLATCSLVGCDLNNEKTNIYAGSVDTSSKPGRYFMYINEKGESVKTALFEEVPPSYRDAILIIEGKKTRIRSKKKEAIVVNVLPLKISTEKTLPGPPSTEKWSEEQWEQELKKEIAELREEEAKEKEKPTL